MHNPRVGWGYSWVGWVGCGGFSSLKIGLSRLFCICYIYIYIYICFVDLYIYMLWNWTIYNLKYILEKVEGRKRFGVCTKIVYIPPLSLAYIYIYIYIYICFMFHVMSWNIICFMFHDMACHNIYNMFLCFVCFKKWLKSGSKYLENESHYYIKFWGVWKSGSVSHFELHFWCLLVSVHHLTFLTFSTRCVQKKSTCFLLMANVSCFTQDVKDRAVKVKNVRNQSFFIIKNY